jgi:hypothetical protein
MTKVKDFFAGFKVEKPEFALLPAGEHTVRLTRVEPLSSFEKYDHQLKDADRLPQWKDACPQLAVTIVSAEPGKSGGMTHRFNGMGYVKYEELSEKERKSGKFENIEGYACTKDDDGDLVRIPSDSRTEQCANIINQFATAVGVKEGENLMLGLNAAAAEGRTLRVTVTNDPYQGKDQLRLTKFRATAKAMTASNGFEA